MSAFIVITVEWDGVVNSASATLGNIPDDDTVTVWDITENLELLYKSMKAAIERPYAKAEEAENV